MTDTTDSNTLDLPAVTPTATPANLTPEEARWRLAERQALAISRASSAVPKAFAGKPGDIISVWLMADELGISRMAALRSMYVVNGKPQLSGDLLMAVARGAGCKVAETVEEQRDEETGAVDLVALCEVTLPGGDVVQATFSTDDAKLAGLWASSDPWKKYPRRMLQMRARGFALRDAIPHLLAGVYAPGELIDVTPDD